MLKWNCFSHNSCAHLSELSLLLPSWLFAPPAPFSSPRSCWLDWNAPDPKQAWGASKSSSTPFFLYFLVCLSVVWYFLQRDRDSAMRQDWNVNCQRMLMTLFPFSGPFHLAPPHCTHTLQAVCLGRRFGVGDGGDKKDIEWNLRVIHYEIKLEKRSILFAKRIV